MRYRDPASCVADHVLHVRELTLVGQLPSATAHRHSARDCTHHADFFGRGVEPLPKRPQQTTLGFTGYGVYHGEWAAAANDTWIEEPVNLMMLSEHFAKGAMRLVYRAWELKPGVKDLSEDKNWVQIGEKRWLMIEHPSLGTLLERQDPEEDE